jgi:tetratricopeptide (TPR) repeat protein
MSNLPNNANDHEPFALPTQRNIHWRRLFVIGSLALTLVIGGALLFSGGNAATAIKQWLSVGQIAPAQSDEMLILVAPFNQQIPGGDPQAQQWIVEQLTAVGTDESRRTIRVEILATTIQTGPTGNAEDAARTLAEQYQASIIMWGTQAGSQVQLHILNLRQPEGNSVMLKPPVNVSFISDDLAQHSRLIALFVRGQIAMSAEDYPAATTLLEAAVQELQRTTMLTGAAEIYVQRGWLYNQSPCQCIEAFAMYNQALDLDPLNVVALNNRGLIYAIQNNSAAALADFTQAIARNPKEVTILNNRAELYIYQENYAAAMADFNQVLAIDPNNTNALYYRGIAYEMQGNDEAALADFNAVLALDPNHASAFYSRANLYAQQGNQEAAIADYTQAISIDRQYTSAVYNRGVVYAKQKNWTAAMSDFDRVIAFDPNHVGAMYARGFIAINQNDMVTAIADYSHVIELDPEYVGAFYYRAIAYVKQRNYTAAQADFEQVLQMVEPTDELAVSTRQILVDLKLTK